jgi:hypothetical protein
VKRGRVRILDGWVVANVSFLPRTIFVAGGRQAKKYDISI